MRFILLAVFFMFSPAALAGTQTNFAGLTLDLPSAGDGWTSKTNESILLLQKALPGRRGKRSVAIIQVLKPVAAFSGGFPKTFAQMTTILPELAKDRPLAKSSGVTVNGYPIRVERRCCASRQGLSLSAIYVGIEGPKTYALLMLGFVDVPQDERKAVEKEFETLVRSIRLNEDDKPFQIVPPKDGGGLEGVYTSLDTGLRPNVFGGLDFYSESRILAFNPSGVYSREIPKGGMDIKGHCQAEPNDCGTYRLTGGGLFGGSSQIERMRVLNSYGMFEKETRPFARDGDDLKIGKADYRHVPPLSKGTRFEGVWRHFFGQSGSTAFSSNSVAVERTLTLTPDGTFTRTGWSGFISSNESGDARTGVTGNSKRPLERGRYEVEGYQLILSGGDGRTERFSLFMPDEGSDGLFVINGSNYLKQKPNKEAR